LREVQAHRKATRDIAPLAEVQNGGAPRQTIAADRRLLHGFGISRSAAGIILFRNLRKACVCDALLWWQNQVAK
jgi:hypothetical protein